MEGDYKNCIVLTAEDTKATIRGKVWDYLSDNELAENPLPPHKRIPNYKSTKETSSKLLELEEFKEAKLIKIDPDKPLQYVRFNALEKGKTIFVPTPRLLSNFLNKLTPTDDSKKNWTYSTKLGMINHSTPINLDSADKDKIDLVIVGAVAVSMKGLRIGKGEGYGDLEHGVMSVMGMIDSTTKIVACVHDCQVFEDLPDALFEQHDVSVDIIVTPSRIIYCEGTGKTRPGEIFWETLPLEKYNAIPVLKKLRYKTWKEGASELKLLKDETEAPKELTDEKIEPILKKGQRRANVSQGREFYGGFRGRRLANNFNNWRSNYRNPNQGRNSRRLRRKTDENEQDEKRNNSVNHDGSGDTSKEDNQDNQRKRISSGSRGGLYRNFQNNRRRIYSDGGRPQGGYRRQGDGWIYVGNIPRNVRVSDFKSVIRGFEKVNPLQFVWKGAAGFAFINFKTMDDAKEAAGSLAGLKMSDTVLKVEMARERENKRRRRNASDVEGSQQPKSDNDDEVKEVSKALDKDLKISDKAEE
ncbi:hypothetical protein HELRODRAFT_190006 [Helobdella robusta]|uniref:Methenyltetrahydrofolate synthase domain-containing protein n=1 Tax=Helobdella robusta TaxID=6412 RepID=T1FRL0_HELRO|nr:hypothetical protein HELRODRAFT_190006 [Helobdella robusta]ESO11573.1 hypothetical protein HELRODRAFT_190006 [Helobdella robusta]